MGRGRALTVEECFRTLGLEPSASAHDVQSAFRRLAKRYHPDQNPTERDARRFVLIVHAYRLLQDEFRARGVGLRLQRCPRCGYWGELMEALDGRAACVNCLLGVTRLQRFLPMPIIEVVRHASVIGLYVASIALAMGYVSTGELRYSYLSLLSAVLGLVVLGVTCVMVRDVR